jgi:hypothetical protein
MDDVELLQQSLTRFTVIAIPILLLLGVVSHIVWRRISGPSKLERALRERLKGIS